MNNLHQYVAFIPIFTQILCWRKPPKPDHLFKLDGKVYRFMKSIVYDHKKWSIRSWQKV